MGLGTAGCGDWEFCGLGAGSEWATEGLPPTDAWELSRLASGRGGTAGIGGRGGQGVLCKVAMRALRSGRVSSKAFFLALCSRLRSASLTCSAGQRGREHVQDN